MEYRQKLAFIWPYMRPQQRVQREAYRPWGLHKMRTHSPIAQLVYCLGAVYMLGIATLVGWVGQQAMYASKGSMLAQAPRVLSA